jgi:hypothetical protein
LTRSPASVVAGIAAIFSTIGQDRSPGRVKVGVGFRAVHQPKQASPSK